ncbi:DUF6850 family outer membrane beta-barrel protein [Larkinella punicea]|uniref:DUF6850 family outer membrane beta-barrel protein n=1 Tax=Larkinella punicea TaxID=2315727 RepID=UPI001058A4D0|nr:DUF6850 family outer membrane beta-barrel protein [Larkinella punicea]
MVFKRSLLWAQLPDSSLGVRHRFAMPLNVWMIAGNPAGLPAASWPNYIRTGLSSDHRAGDFRRPQEPEVVRAGSFSTEGLRRLGDWAVSGRFRYRKHADQNQRWGNTADPLSGNPFVWADEYGGDWQRDHIQTEVHAGRVINDRVTGGLSIRYDLGQGARQNDPRPFYRFRDLSLRPSFLWQLSRRHWLGVWAEYRHTLEENQIGYYAIQTPQLYRLRGLGTFDRSPVVSSDRLVTGRWFGGSMQTGVRLDHNRHLTGMVSVHFGSENTGEGIAVERPNGRYEERRWEGKLAMDWMRSDGLRRLNLSASRRSGDGTDPIFKAINVGFTRQEIQLEVLQNRQRTHSARQVSAQVGYTHQEAYNILNQTNWAIHQVHVRTNYLIRMPLRGRWVAFAEPVLAMVYAPHRSYQALRPTELTPLLVKPDFSVRSANYGQLGGEAGVDCRLRNSWLRVAFEGQWEQPFQGIDDVTGHRSFSSLSIQFFH